MLGGGVFYGLEFLTRERPTIKEVEIEEEEAVIVPSAAQEEGEITLPAIRETPKDPGVRAAYELYKAGDPAGAAARLERTILDFPSRPDAHYLLGRIHFEQGRTESAVQSLESALRLDPNAPGAKELLLRARGDAGLKKNISLYFDFYYRGARKEEFAVARSRIANLLDQAYLRTFQKFFVKLEKGDRVQVHFYEARDFHASLRPDSWTGGLFDGKIRIPLGDYSQDEARVKATIFHEYAHAVIYRLSPRCPVWLNEGVAQALSDADASQSQARLKGRQSSFLSASRLKSSFKGLTAEQALLAYDMSFSMVERLRRQKGLVGIKKFLEELGSSGNFDVLFKKHFYQSYDRFYEDWKKEQH